MKTLLGTLKATLAVAFLATLLAPLANAQCVSPTLYKPTALLQQQPLWGSESAPVAFLPAAYDVAEGSTSAIADPIVGFWKVTFISEGNEGIPNGTPLDKAYAQWHADGTEVMNSSRPPATQSFCLGVWKKVAPFKYKLNHFAKSWNADGTFLGPGNIREEVTLSPDHNSFSGTFTVEQFNPSGGLIVRRTGDVVGERITLNTTVTDLL